MAEPPLKEIEEVFHQAAALDEPERGPFLDVACADDPKLRSAVETLLRNDRESTDVFLVSPVASRLGTEDPTLPAAAPQQAKVVFPAIPGYRVLKELGRGGMGVRLHGRADQSQAAGRSEDAAGSGTGVGSGARSFSQ